MPNMDDQVASRDRIFGIAQSGSTDDSGQVRRTITMVRDDTRACPLAEDQEKCLYFALLFSLTFH